MAQTSCLSSARAASADEAGFWPVIRSPSVTTWECPVRDLGINAALVLQHVLDQEGHDFGQAHGLFLGVGKTRDRLALDERLAVG